MPFIAKGTYGCVFKPHIPCDNQKQEKGAVGKVFEYPETMQSEQHFLDLMKQIDPHGEFTLPYQGSCATVSKFRKTDIEPCGFIRPGYKYQQLLIPYGGKSLKQWMTTRKGSFHTFMKMLHRIKPVVEGLYRMRHTFGYIHQDIKPDNILFHKGKLFLIDFSLMTKVTEVYSESNEGVLQASYPYFPPEYKYYTYRPQTLQAYKNMVKPNYNFASMVDKGEQDFWYLFDMSGMQPISELKDFMQKRIPSSHFSQKFAGTVDIFSLGIVLALLYQWCGMDKIEYKKASKKKLLHHQILELLRSMLCLNPYHRAEYQDVLRQLNQILQTQ